MHKKLLLFAMNFCTFIVNDFLAKGVYTDDIQSDLTKYNRGH